MPDPAVGPLTPILAAFAPLGRAGLLPALQAAQSLSGFLSESTTAQIAAALGVPLADVHGVIDFYSLLTRATTELDVQQDRNPQFVMMSDGFGPPLVNSAARLPVAGPFQFVVTSGAVELSEIQTGRIARAFFRLVREQPHGLL